MPPTPSLRFGNPAIPLGGMKLRKVRRRELITLLEAAAAQPRQAALLLVYIKCVMMFAEDREWIEANPAATVRPRRVSETMAFWDEIRAFSSPAGTCGMHRPRRSR